MPRGRVLVAAGLLAALTACSSDPAPPGAAGGTATATVSSPQPTSSTATTPPAGPAATSSPPDAGPLSAANVPPATALGGSWATNTAPPPDAPDPGKASWLTPRDPADVAAGLVPIGCSGLTATPQYPAPAHALQGRYVSKPDGLNAVVLVLDYASDATARSFLAQFVKDISACPAPAGSGPQSPYVRAVTVTEATDTRVLDHWREYGVGAGSTVWHEVVVRDGSRIGLADVETAAGVNPDLTGLGEVLRRAVKS